MLSILHEYQKIPKHVIYVIVAEFFIQLVNSSFLAIQPLFMQKNGYTDTEIAGYVGYQYLGILVLALPIGLYIKNKKIKNLFYLSGYGVPVFAIGIVYATANHIDWLIYPSQLLWGASFTFIQIPILPFIFRTSPKETHTASITLSYSTWSFASIIGGLLIGLLNDYDHVLFNEEHLLILISILSFGSLYFIKRTQVIEDIPLQFSTKHKYVDYDWGRIIKALIPTFIIAVGAGFTIPFLNLFFVNVHHLTTSQYSYIYSIGAILVAASSIAVPSIKRRWGYQKAIPVTQSIAIIALVLMATTQYYSQLEIAIYIAILFFLLRQPLMNMAGPMTTDVVMSFAGSKNREMVSALTMAIWSGSWFVSSHIFKVLRKLNYNYATIFLITAVLYVVGVIWYYVLIKEYQKIKEV